MQIKRFKIKNIPAVLWGKDSNKVFIAVHGNMSHKEDKVIKILADIASKKGYQVLSFDLPEHGDRKCDTDYLCIVQNCIKDLEEIANYANSHYTDINLFRL